MAVRSGLARGAVATGLQSAARRSSPDPCDFAPVGQNFERKVSGAGLFNRGSVERRFCQLSFVAAFPNTSRTSESVSSKRIGSGKLRRRQAAVRDVRPILREIVCQHRPAQLNDRPSRQCFNRNLPALDGARMVEAAKRSPGASSSAGWLQAMERTVAADVPPPDRFRAGDLLCHCSAQCFLLDRVRRIVDYALHIFVARLALQKFSASCSSLRTSTSSRRPPA